MSKKYIEEISKIHLCHETWKTNQIRKRTQKLYKLSARIRWKTKWGSTWHTAYVLDRTDLNADTKTLYISA